MPKGVSKYRIALINIVVGLAELDERHYVNIVVVVEC